MSGEKQKQNKTNKKTAKNRVLKQRSESHNIIQKCPFSIWKPQFEWKKIIGWYQHQDDKNLRIIWQRFWSSHYKMLWWAITNPVELIKNKSLNNAIEILSKEVEDIKNNQMEGLGWKNTITDIKISVGRLAEQKGQRKKVSEIEDRRFSNLNNRSKIDWKNK